MDSKDFFGAPDPMEKLSKPSILSIVVEHCVNDFASMYRATGNGKWEVVTDGGIVQCTITDADVTEDICAWVHELDGGDAIGNKIMNIVSSNPGWEKIVARRVIKEMKKWESDAP
jgi:hypothetical protein